MHLPAIFPYPLRRARRALRRLGVAGGERRNWDSVQQFVFIVTYGRSGSTLVQKLIGGLPGYHIRGENSDALRGLVRSYQAALKAKEEFGKQPTPPDTPWYGAYDIDPRSYGETLADQFVRQILMPPPDARAVGFKEIRYFHEPEELETYIAFIRQFFAPARFVFNTRNPEAVAGSSWWKEKPREEVVAQIADWNRTIEAYVARHPQDCLLVHYDAFVADPERLRPLFEFLGEPYDPDYVAQTLEKRLQH
ncbi:MAG: sulfotransferase family protein [Phenylobacterium sp.]|uniref:sulfotransferase family protein n=1 Tax=Phenylobacterium sp. TaxID=1871053 RepID=UPI00391ACA07